MLQKTQKREEIVFHFNKKHLSEPTVPMWVVKCRGDTYYVDHVDVSPGVGFSTKETPDNPHTKWSIKFKGNMEIEEENNIITAKIF